MSGALLVLLVIVFVISAGLDNLRKTGQGTGAPRRPGLPPRPQAPQLPGASAPGSPAGGGASTPAQSAETLVPDELWELLTGQRRPGAPRPAPPPPPEAGAQRSTFEPLPTRRPVYEPEAVPAATRSADEHSLESDSPPAPVAARGAPLPRVAPAIVPALAAAPAAGSPSPQVPAAPLAAPPSAAARLGLRGPRDLRRALVLQVVLGPPKALE